MAKGWICGLLLGAALTAFGQGPPGPGSRGGGPGGFGPGDHGPDNRGGPGSRGFGDGAGNLAGKWWTKPSIIQRLVLSEEQQKRLDQIYQQSRLRLIDLTAALAKEEAVMEPLLAAEHPQEAQVLAQIDRIAQARADLEKANARMLFGLRMVLTPEQWKELQSRNVFMPPGPGRR